MQTIMQAAQGLFDTDDDGNVINIEDVHPEYIRAVIELTLRYAWGDTWPVPEDGYIAVAHMLGLPAQHGEQKVSAPETFCLAVNNKTAEYMILRHEGDTVRTGNPLNPNNGSLEQTLKKYAVEGWALLSYDWNTWRNAVLVREVTTRSTEVEAARARVAAWVEFDRRNRVRGKGSPLGISYDEYLITRADLALLAGVES